MIYVASSWRNVMHTAVCAVLESAKLEHYDFKSKLQGGGFHWKEVMANFPEIGPGSPEIKVDPDDYLKALDTPRANRAYVSDFVAMQKADTFILVLPCGRSSHLELGWAVGQGKRTAVLLEAGAVVPELMYKMVDYLAPTLFDLLGWLGVED